VERGEVGHSLLHPGQITGPSCFFASQVNLGFGNS
jgi:hypothetical protein